MAQFFSHRRKSILHSRLPNFARKSLVITSCSLFLMIFPYDRPHVAGSRGSWVTVIIGSIIYRNLMNRRSHNFLHFATIRIEPIIRDPQLMDGNQRAKNLTHLHTRQSRQRSSRNDSHPVPRFVADEDIKSDKEINQNDSVGKRKHFPRHSLINLTNANFTSMNSRDWARNLNIQSVRKIAAYLPTLVRHCSQSFLRCR